MQGNHLFNAHRLLGWALALFLVAGPGFAATITGRVVAVSDGDTLTVLDADRTQHKIRLSGIDAPEKAQAFGERSKQNLSRLVFGKEIEVQWNKRDLISSLGSALGAFTSGFILVPVFGFRVSSAIAGVINIAAAILLLLLTNPARRQQFDA